MLPLLLKMRIYQLVENKHLSYVNLLTTGVSDHIESSQLICRANQLTDFYMTGNIGH